MYPEILQRYNEAFKTVVPEIPNILGYLPTTLQAYPAMFSRAMGFTEHIAVRRVSRRYRIAHCLCFVFQDNEEAEREMGIYLDAVPNAVNLYQLRGGIVSSQGDTAGMAGIVSGDVMEIPVGNVSYLGIVFISETLEKTGLPEIQL